MGGPTIGGKPVGALFGKLNPTHRNASKSDLQKAFAKDGYVYLRDALPRHIADSARARIFDVLGHFGELHEPYFLGIPTGASRRAAVGDLPSFWKWLSNSGSVGAIPRSRHIQRLVEAVLDGPSIHQDYRFLRTRTKGFGTRMHCDAPYFAKSGSRIVTVWISLGEIRPNDGGLYLVESRRPLNYGKPGTARSDENEERPEPLTFARSHNLRLRSADFRPGDLVIFQMWVSHGSFDNSSTVGKVRLSLDIRYQHRSARRDASFFGLEPKGITGEGYAEMLCALPMHQQ